MKDAVTVRYVDADPHLEREDSFLNLLVSKALSRPVAVVRDGRVNVDIQFTSVQLGASRRFARELRRGIQRVVPGFHSQVDSRWATLNPLPRGKAKAHIWFTGENIRPPSGPWDGYLSFDLDPMDGKNAYCPLWWWSLDLLGPAHSPFIDPAPDIRSLVAPRLVSPERPGFAVAFVNNPDPMRLRMISEMRRFGTVDVFGRMVGKPVPDKMAVAKNYKFVLCFENDLYPGYVTEKPIEAWACGAVPIWWGLDPAGYLNPAAMINAQLFPTFRHAAEYVAQLNADCDAWADTASRALLLQPPDLSAAISVIQRAVDS